MEDLLIVFRFRPFGNILGKYFDIFLSLKKGELFVTSVPTGIRDCEELECLTQWLRSEPFGVGVLSQHKTLVKIQKGAEESMRMLTTKLSPAAIRIALKASSRNT
jgi:hypothetical protein